MKIYWFINFLSLSIITALLLVLLFRKNKEKYNSKLTHPTEEKTFILSPDGVIDNQYRFVSSDSPNTYSLGGAAPGWLTPTTLIAISNIRKNSTYLLAGVSNGILYFDGMHFAVPRYVGRPNILEEVTTMMKKGELVYLYPL